MSKSNNNDDLNTNLLSEILEALREGRENRYGSETSRNEAASRMEEQYSIDWMDRATKEQVKQITRVHEQMLKSFGIEMKKGFKGGDIDRMTKTLEKFVTENQVTNKELLSAVNTFYNKNLNDSNNKEKAGKKGSLKGFEGNENKELKTILAEMRKDSGAMGAIDSSMRKVVDFFEGPKLKKTLSAVGADLIDGLEKSKWIGGGFRDTFKLLGLMGAQWLSQFGALGRMMGAALYVAMETFGPQLVKLLLQGMGTLTMGLLRGLGTLLTGALRGVGRLLIGIPKFLGLGATAGTAIGVTGALWAFNEAKDSEKKGRQGNANSFKVGGGYMAAGAGVALTAGIASGTAGILGAAGATGAAGIATTIAGFLGPIGWTLIGIGAAIAGLAALWKYHGETIKKWFSKIGEFLGKIADAVGGIFGNLFKKDKKEGTSRNVSSPTSPAGPIEQIKWENARSQTQLLSNKVNSSRHLDPKKMTKEDWAIADKLEPEYGSMGEIVNLGKMTQRRAAEVIKADISQKGSKSYYEIGDPSLVSKPSFQTDAADEENVYFVRGTNESVRNDLNKLKSMGFDVSTTKITSGIGTLGSPKQMSTHTYSDSLSGHFGPTSTVDVSPIYYKGRVATTADYGKYLRHHYYNLSEGDHEHWAYGPLKQQINAMTEATAVKTTNDMMTVQDVVKALPEEDRKKFAEELQKGESKSPEDLVKREEKILKGMGIYKSDQFAGSPWVREGSDGTVTLLKDVHGNYLFSELRKIANQGAN